jgi:hypothetical protein
MKERKERKEGKKRWEIIAAVCNDIMRHGTLK